MKKKLTGTQRRGLKGKLTDSLITGTKKRMIWMAILFVFNSSQWFWNPPCDCASTWVWVPGEALLALERLCAACTPVEGMNRGGGRVNRELQTDWRQQQNRGHAWSTTQNKSGHTTTTAPQAVGQGWQDPAENRLGCTRPWLNVQTGTPAMLLDWVLSRCI